ncbi:hypothetical protein MRX96_051203 [Rhipicephalus microplus]
MPAAVLRFTIQPIRGPCSTAVMQHLGRRATPFPGPSTCRGQLRDGRLEGSPVTRQCQRVLSELLIIKELSSVPVTARKPTDRRSRVGFLHGVDGGLTNLELTAGLASTVSVLAANKEGQMVRLRFVSSQSTDQVTLCDLELRAQHAWPRPLQCRQFGHFGHVSEAWSARMPAPASDAPVNIRPQLPDAPH